MAGFITVHEAAKIIGVSPDTIRRWDKKGLIKAHRSALNYRVFDVEEIRKTHDKISYKSTENNYRILKSKPTEHTVIELFSGAGGTALGFENSGLKDVMLVEYDKNAAATLKKNRPKWNVSDEDIHKVSFKGMKADVVEGGFPCQTFSYAGKKMGFEDARGTLFLEFARCVKEVRPKIAMGENVRGLEKHDGGRTLSTMIRILEDIGYRVVYKIVRAQYLDVPQKRERLIMIAVRKDLNMPFLFPKEKDYTISVKEALADCPPSDGQEYPPKKVAILKLVPPGGYWRDLPPKLQREYMKGSLRLSGGKTGMARRLSWDEPSLTLTCSPAQKQTERCHPKETRPLRVREYARIQTFPDSWRFEGSVSSAYRQIGNAVPVNLAYHIGRCLIAMLENKPDFRTMELVARNVS
ncbi:MAG: DNA (cytosine-5-)-methyltransferase [Candidatus Liptonbacteria bacterium]|nr:DNA (cytosine-5-)-methyltransferase [Candidatus Liptonbacteria bacterium]